MKKLKIYVRDGCPNCDYVLRQLERLGLRDRVEVVKADSSIKATPAIETDDGVEPVMGNVYGVLKIVMYMKRAGLLEEDKASSGDRVQE